MYNNSNKIFRSLNYVQIKLVSVCFYWGLHNMEKPVITSSRDGMMVWDHALCPDSALRCCSGFREDVKNSSNSNIFR